MYKRLLFLIPLLFLFSCDKVETNEEQTEYPTTLTTVDSQGFDLIVSLIGDETLTINIGSEYIEQGIEIVYEGDDDISYYSNGSVNTSNAGHYTIDYRVYVNGIYWATVSRVIHVDDLNPTIQFSEPIYINNETEEINYFQGLIAQDYLLADISSFVEVDASHVIQDRPGTYEITYHVTDSFGYSIDINRNVLVSHYSEHIFNTEEDLTNFYENISDIVDISVSFGDAISLDDDIIAVGAPEYKTDGAVIIYDTAGTELMTIDGSNYLGEATYPLEFGTEVALTDNFLIVGAPFYLNENLNLGAIILFPRTGNTFDTLNPIILQQEDVYQYRIMGFGKEFIAKDDLLIVSNTENNFSSSELSVLVYKLNTNENNYTLIQTIYPVSNDDYNYGYHLTLENDYLAISTELAFLDKDKVYLYKYDGTTFNFEETYIPEDHTQSGLFGEDVAIYEDTMFVSAPWHFTDGRRSGVIYMYDLTKSPSEPGGVVSFTSPNVTMYEGFGKAIEVMGDYLVVTSYKIESNDSIGKGIYIYRISDLINGDFTPIEQYYLNNQDVKGFGNVLSVHGDMIVIGSPFTSSSTYKSGCIDILSFESETILDEGTKLVDDQKNNYTVTINDVETDTFFIETSLNDGTYQFVSQTSEGYSYTYKIIYDKTAPDFGDKQVYSSNNTIQVNANELLVSYQVDDTDMVILDAPSQTISIELQENGVYHIKVYDIAGNVSTLTYVYDNEAPIVTSVLFEVGDLYQEITAEETWSFTRFGTTFDYNNDIMIGASNISEDRNVFESYAYLFQKEGMDFTFIERIAKPYTSCDNFAKQVAINETDLFIASTYTDESGTYDVIYVYHRDSSDFSIPDSVIEISQGTIVNMEVDGSNLVVLYNYLSSNSVCVYDVSQPTYLRTDINKSASESITDISIYENSLAMSSTESRVYIYDIDTKEVRIIDQSGNTGGTSYLALYKQTLAVRNSNSYNSYIYVYDLTLEPGFSGYKKEIYLGGFNDGVSLSLNDSYLAVGNSNDDIVYLFDLYSENIQLTKLTLNGSGGFFGNHLLMNNEFLLVSNPDSRFNTYAGAISVFYLRDFYQLDIQDLSFGGDLFEVVNESETPIAYPYIFETNSTISILVEDLAGNQYTETNNYENLTIEFTNNRSIISDTEFLIETNKYFNAYSLDNGVTYTSVDTTNHYLIEGLEHGEYTILVKYDDLCSSNRPLVLIVDTKLPVLELIQDQLSELYTNKILHLHSFKYRVESASFAVHDDYILIVYRETVDTDAYQNKVYIFNRHLSEGDEGYLTVIESLVTTEYTNRLGSIFIEGDLLYFISAEDGSQGLEVVTYIYDLSNIDSDDFLINKVVMEDYGLTLSKSLFEDNYLFLAGQSDDEFGNSVNKILVYTYNTDTDDFQYQREIICHFEGRFRHMDYDNFKLVVSSTTGELSIYDLTKTTPAEQYLGTIEGTPYQDHPNNPLELENVAIYDHLLVVYIEYPTDVYDEETEDQDKLYFYDLNDGDLMVDYIYDIDFDLESLNGLSGHSNNLQFLENGNLYVGKNYTVYNTELLRDGITETDTIEEIHMLSIPNQDALNTPDLWLTNLYIHENDIHAIFIGGWHTSYASETYVYQFNSNGVAYQIMEDNEYLYDIYLDGVKIDNPTNQILGLNGLYDFVIKESSGLTTTETFMLHMNPPIITSFSEYVQDSYDLTADQPFTKISLDNGLTYQTIPETTHYLLTGLNPGIYDIKVMTSSGKTSKSVKVIFDHISPEINLLTSVINDEGFTYSSESYYTFTDYVIYNDFLYYVSAKTLYRINLELEPYQIGYDTKVKVLRSNAKSIYLAGDKLYVFYNQEETFSIFDLSKESTEAGYFEEYTSSLEMNTYDDFANAVAVVNHYLVVFLDYASSTERDDALIIYDLRLSFDDPNFETIYTPDFLGANQYFARSLYGYEDLVICRSYDSNTHNSFITVYDFTVTPGEPGFETQVDLGLENVIYAFDDRAFDDGKLFFTYKDKTNFNLDSAIIDFSKAENEAGFITYLDIEILENIEPKYIVMDNDCVFAYLEQPENYEGDRTIIMLDLSKVAQDPSDYLELSTHIFADDEVMTSKMLVYNHQLFIITNNYQFATLSNNFVHTIFFEETYVISVSDDFQITSTIVKLNDEEIELNRLKQLLTPGVYEIAVIDASGNESVETYTIT